MQGTKYRRVFNDKEKLNEMLGLARQGHSYSSLGRLYGVDHTSIMFQCSKHGVTNGVMYLQKKGRYYPPKAKKRGYNTNNPAEEQINYGLPSYHAYLRADRLRKLGKVDKLLLKLRRK